MMWMRRWRRRVLARRPYLRPPTPDPESLAEARMAARTAVDGYHRALELEPAVTERAAKAERIHRENNLGPSFWRAMEGRRA